MDIVPPAAMQLDRFAPLANGDSPRDQGEFRMVDEIKPRVFIASSSEGDVADLLSRVYGGNMPVLCLWADRHTYYPATSFLPPDNWINGYVVAALSEDQVQNILVVEDITRRGETITGAKDFLAGALPGKLVRSGILLAPPAAENDIDYVAQIADTRHMQTAFTLIED